MSVALVTSQVDPLTLSSPRCFTKEHSEWNTLNKKVISQHRVHNNKTII